MESVTVGSAAMNLTYKILGHKTDSLLNILKQLTSELGVSNIAYVRMASSKSTDSNLLTAGETTYPREWMRPLFR